MERSLLQQVTNPIDHIRSILLMKRKLFLLGLVILLALEPALAMHIMEGYMPLGWCIFWYVVSIPFLYVSYRHIRQLIGREPRQRITFALNTAFVFVLSALKLPSVTGSSSHLTGTTLGTITSGAMSMPLVGLVVLIFQALILAHGGISTLGANVFSLAIVGPLAAIGVYKLMQQLSAVDWLSVGVAAFVGSMATYVTTSVQLAVVYPDAIGGVVASFVKFMSIFAITQLPLSLVEAVLTVVVIRLIRQASMSRSSHTEPAESLRSRIALSIGALVCLVLPLMAGYVDFGEGTDDAAGGMVQTLRPGFEENLMVPLFEPSEALEPWLFVLQVAVGIGLFVWGYRSFARMRRTH